MDRGDVDPMNAETDTTGLGAVPFVIAFFSVPAFVTSVLLAQVPDTTTRHGSEP